MRTILSATLIAVLTCGLVSSAWSAEDDSKSVVDKAIQAIGGEAKLKGAKGLTWQSKGTLHFGDNESSYTAKTTVSGLDQLHSEFEADFGGNPFKLVLVINGDKGWRTINDNNMELGADELANEKRNGIYLQLIPAGMLLPLQTKDFKTESAGEEKVGDAETRVVKVTAPDGKDFKLFFDKKSNLPVRLVAEVQTFMGEVTQETLYSDFKDFDGVKKAAKHTVKHDGNVVVEAELTEFKVLDKVDPETFAEPK